MWCAKCKADVAAEVSLDNRRVRCASCGSELTAAPLLASDPKTQQARQLLQRWSNGDLLDPRGPAVETSRKHDMSTSAPATTPPEAPRPATESARPSEPVTTKFRVDTTHDVPSGDADVHPSRSVHPAHPSNLSRPHFDVQSAIDGPPKKANSAALVGQLMAYLGVAVLTIGTALILWGYFGGPAHYTPTGWLAATAGQMLLFLGVITLVSGGMEQTNEDVARRIDAIGQRILRIEQAAGQHALKGPSIPAERFADGTGSSHKREVVKQQAGR